MNRRRGPRAWLVGVLIVSVLGLANLVPAEAQTPPPALSIPGSGSRTFPETGQTVTGVFLDYWDAHGGLSQQGYPISGLLDEASDLDPGQHYTVQYFERAVFEYHPEYAGTSSEVLLAQLGTYQYKQTYPDGAARQQVSTVNPRFFPETGHTVGGLFRVYWEAHGGLAQQGYPLTDEFPELSPLDHQIHTVQYFERAVFEDHPENMGSPYEVLLSQLGTYRYAAKTQQPPGPRLLAEDVPGWNVSAAEHIVLWDRPFSADRPILGYDLAQDKALTLVSGEGASGRVGPVSDGTTVAWIEGTPGGDSIRGYDLAAGHSQYLVEPAYYHEFDQIALGAGQVYYQDAKPEQNGLFARNLATGLDTLVSAWGRAPVVANGILLWVEQRPPDGPHALANPPQPQPPSECSLHMRRLDGSLADAIINSSLTPGPFAGDCYYAGYSTAGDYVAWTGGYLANQPLWLHRLSTGSDQLIAHAASHPLLTGDTLIWTEQPTGFPDAPTTWAIKAYDLATAATRTLVQGQENQVVTGWALTGSNQLVYTVGAERNDPAGKLYVTDIRPAGTP